MQSLHSLGMRGATRPISLRLAPCHIERLKGRDGFCPGNLIRENPFHAPHKNRLLLGREHGRTILLADLAIKKSKCTRGLAGALQGVLESLLTPAERWRMSAVEGRMEVRIAGPDFRFLTRSGCPSTLQLETKRINPE